MSKHDNDNLDMQTFQIYPDDETNDIRRDVIKVGKANSNPKMVNKKQLKGAGKKINLSKVFPHQKHSRKDVAIGLSIGIFFAVAFILFDLFK